jgi:hypothetical protein
MCEPSETYGSLAYVAVQFIKARQEQQIPLNEVEHVEIELVPPLLIPRADRKIGVLIFPLGVASFDRRPMVEEVPEFTEGFVLCRLLSSI